MVSRTKDVGLGQPNDRLQWKIRLVRSLYDRGQSKTEVSRIFRLIDWMIDLPTDLETDFRRAVEQIEEEKRMPYVTSVERLARAEGLTQGIEQGIEQGFERGIERSIQTVLRKRFGEAGLSTAKELSPNSELSRLEQLLEAATTVESLEQLRAWFAK